MKNHITIKTEKGDIKIDLFEDVPKTKANFLKHVEMGYYNNTTFYRVNNFCIQGGHCNPELKGYIPTERLPQEITYHRHAQYSVGMADGGPGTATVHFFINKGENAWMNRRYIVFGQVTAGMRTVWAIKQGDKILEVKVDKD